MASFIVISRYFYEPSSVSLQLLTYNKAANLLIDEDGTVLLGDLGVAVALTDDESAAQSQRSAGQNAPQGRPSLLKGKRRSFVGTVCAPFCVFLPDSCFHSPVGWRQKLSRRRIMMQKPIFGE
jgi:hypothetical protein